MARAALDVQSHRFLAVTILLLALYVLGAFSGGSWLLDLIHGVGACLVLLLASTGARRGVRPKRLPWWLAGLTLALLLSGLAWNRPWIEPATRSSFALFVLVALLDVLRHVLQPSRVDREKIFAAIAALFLFGLFWGFVYAAVDRLGLEPAPFAGLTGPAGEGDAPRLAQLMYYSFTTLTTLGYGDIVPTHPLTRSLATVEAVTGQLYVAVLIARLVALHVVHEEQPPG